MGKTCLDYNPTLVDLANVPKAQHHGRFRIWEERFKSLVDGKALMLRYNTQQRAHQVSESMRAASRRLGFRARARIIHATPEIQGSDDWFLYFWKDSGNGSSNKV